VYRLLIIFFFLTGLALAARAQVVPPVQGSPVNTPVSNANKTISSYEKKLKAKKDSAASLVNKEVHVGPQKKTPKDSSKIAQHHLTPAPLDAEKPEPAKMMPSLDHTSCKEISFIPMQQDSANMPVASSAPKPKPAKPAPPHIPFLQIHGNVMYNLNYYSRIDTPYNEHDIYQHTIQTWLDILVKGQYPVRIFLTNHFSNSSLFRNYSDFNFSYNNSGFNQQLRDQVRREYLQTLPSQKTLDSLQRILNSDWQKLNGLSGWVRNPALIQKMVEAREAAMRKKPAQSDSSSGKTLPDEADSILINKQRDADSLRKEVARIQEMLQALHQRSQTEVGKTTADIQKLDNPAALHKELDALGISDSSLPKGYKTLMAIKSFDLGRTVVNYSELSAKNISVNGVQAEYNPSNYYAVAAGSVDYRFRDFIVQGPGNVHQYLNIYRVGKGLKDGNSVILTYFMGKRQLYNAGTTDTGSTQVPASGLMGLTLQGNYHFTRNILLSGEIAKSSSPSYVNDSTTKGSAGKGLFALNDHSNEAWSVQANAFFPASNTRLKGMYKHLSANYQSFSIFTDGSAQSAWSANVDQLLFKKQLELQVGANTNDFSNPFIGQEYKSTTVFKSIQATFRRRNWPTVSFGYFPSSQLTKTGGSDYVENLFYTMVGNLTHSYVYHHLMMNTTLVYTQFYNRSVDSGFTYFNTRNLMLSQTLFLNKFTFQVSGTAAANQDYQLYTLEGKAQHTFSKVLTLGAGIKYNKQTVYNIEQLGYSAEASLKLNRLGQIQLLADKGFVPGMDKRLVPDNTGRLTYYKTF
jgi:hypothetical protein